MFGRNESGSAIVIVALALPALLFGVGGVIEASRAISFNQRLSSAVELSCRQGAAYINGHKAPLLTSSQAFSLYYPKLVSIKDKNFTAKSMNVDANIFQIMQDGDAIKVSATGEMKLIFSVFDREKLSFSTTRTCALSPAEVGELLVTESFERPSHNVNYNSWTVLTGTSKNSADNRYKWNGNWETQNAGIEINGQRELASNSIRFGDFFAELDSHCYVTNCNSNSAMAYYRKLTPGKYQIRYWYIARVRDSSIPGKTICGKTSSEVSYYTKDEQTNRIEVYVEKSGDYNFKPENMVDVCVQSDSWIERVIDFTVDKEREYKVTWRAAGKQDTLGGLIDNLRICRNGCPG